MVHQKFKVRGVLVELKINKNISYQNVYSINIHSDYGIPEKHFIEKLITYLKSEGFINNQLNNYILKLLLFILSLINSSRPPMNLHIGMAWRIHCCNSRCRIFIEPLKNFTTDGSHSWPLPKSSTRHSHRPSSQGCLDCRRSVSIGHLLLTICLPSSSSSSQ